MIGHSLDRDADAVERFQAGEVRAVELFHSGEILVSHDPSAFATAKSKPLSRISLELLSAP